METPRGEDSAGGIAPALLHRWLMDARLDAGGRYLEAIRRTGRSDDPRRANAGMEAEYELLREILGA